MKLSILTITYNHSQYISQAIESFLMQKTDFEFEIIIADDASTDNNQDIIREYHRKYPNLIKPILREENIGMNANFMDALNKCQGKYIALCEGDDYWTDPLKLQKQVDFLEGHPEYGLCYSKVKVYNNKLKKFQRKTFGKKVTSVDELLIENTIPTPTVLFHKDLYNLYNKDIQPQLKNWLMGDYPFWLWVTFNSKIQFFNTEFAVYRILENSQAHSRDYKKEFAFLNSYQNIKLFYINKFGRYEIENKIWQRYFSNKAYLFLFKKEEKISDLLKEIKNFTSPTLKLKVLKHMLRYQFLRRLLKCYWKR